MSYFSEIVRLIAGMTPFSERKRRERHLLIIESNFDERFFDKSIRPLLHNDTTVSKLPAFELYCKYVKRHRLSPNSFFNEDKYLSAYSDVKQAVDAGGFESGFHHWLSCGRNEGRLAGSDFQKQQIEDQSRLFLSCCGENDIDQIYYEDLIGKANPFISKQVCHKHFADEGLHRGIVPNEWFDEHFYLSYYADIKDAVEKEVLPSGFFHFVVAGRTEKRFASHDRGKLAARKMGGGDLDTAMLRVSQIEHRLKPLAIDLSVKLAARLIVLIPSLDPDIFFGGYIAFLHFLCRAKERGYVISFVVTQDGQSNRNWFLSQIKNNERWHTAFSTCAFTNIRLCKEPLLVGYNDICICYSAWEAFDAFSISQHTAAKKFIWFIQEYEAVFHPHDCYSFMVNSAYSLPHEAIFNSASLADFFMRNGLIANSLRKQTLCFEHALARSGSGMQAVRRSGSLRRLVLYARPENHAARNLFEIAILALKAAIIAGVFTRHWEFFGIGGLAPNRNIPLGKGHSLQASPRVSLVEYADMLYTFDVGLSLMYAPHPSVVPYELAQAGVVTVTNTYNNRSWDYLSGLGHNIVPARNSISGVVEALREAVQRSENFEERANGLSLKFPKSWDESFNDRFFDEFQKTLEVMLKEAEVMVENAF